MSDTGQGQAVTRSAGDAGGARQVHCCVGKLGVSRLRLPASLPAKHAPALAGANAVASIRLDGPDASTAPASLAARTGTLASSAEMLVLVMKMECWEPTSGVLLVLRSGTGLYSPICQSTR